ncbi:MAG: hypothetical protein ACKOF9_04255 [Burkholderiales bacterium]
MIGGGSIGDSVVAGGEESFAISGSNSTQSNFGSSGAITQTHQLAASPSAQSNFASSGAITLPAPGSITLVGGASVQPNTSAAGAITQAQQLVGSASVQANVSASGAISVPTTGGVANPADVWNYVLANGKTAAQNVLETRQMVDELYRIHGLLVGEPLTVATTQRTAGDIMQLISESSGVVTVTRA